MPRTEKDVFDELAQLCAAPGYVHAIAQLSLRDNVVWYKGSMTASDTRYLFSEQRLLRTEICTLIGLMVKAPIDTALPEPEVLRQLVDRSDQLLAELHEAISDKAFRREDWKRMLDEKIDPFERGSGLQEPFFYSGESAYQFQYRDFAVPKYTRDDAWLQLSKGFGIDTAERVVKAIALLLDDTIVKAGRKRLASAPETLSGFTFTIGAVAEYSGLPSIS